MKDENWNTEVTSLYDEASSPSQHCLPQWNHVCSLLHAALELIQFRIQNKKKQKIVHNLAHIYRYSIRKYFVRLNVSIVTTSGKLWQWSEESTDGLPSSCPSPALSAQTTGWETAWSRMLWWRQVSIIVSDFPLCGLPEAPVFLPVIGRDPWAAKSPVLASMAAILDLFSSLPCWSDWLVKKGYDYWLFQNLLLLLQSLLLRCGVKVFLLQVICESLIKPIKITD